MAHRRLGVTRADHLLNIAAENKLGEPLLDHGRIHQTGEDGIAADVFRCVLRGNGAGQLQDRPFRCCVGQKRDPHPTDTRDRGNIDDGTLSSTFHERDRVFAGEKHTLHIDGRDLVPFVLVMFDRTTHAENTDIVVKDVDPSESIVTGLYHRRYLIAVGHVTADSAGLVSFVGNYSGRLFRRC